MKRIIIMVLLLTMGLSCAHADSWEADTASNILYKVESFETELPQELREAMDETPFAKDPVLCGATLGYYGKKQEKMLEQIGLIAVEHEGGKLLLSAWKQDDTWVILPESETLLRKTGTFTITAQPAKYANGPMINTARGGGMMLAVDYGTDAFLLSPVMGVERYENLVRCNWFEVYAYQKLDEKGDGLTITCAGEGAPWVVQQHQGSSVTEAGEYQVCWPVRAEYVEGDAFPTDEAQLKAWAEAHPMDMDSWWVFAANLRMFPTTDSRSYGKNIIAPLEPVFVSAGWTMVKLGDTFGWISNTYVAHENQDYPRNHMMCQVAPPPVARAEKETALCVMAGGEEKQTLAKGSVMQILAAGDGWYHVQIPKGEMTWQLDVPAVYGYVRAEDVTAWTSPLRLKYEWQ
ncbi:MAG: hypothetical protein IJ507_10395 [Clostridia bacterium]|nr:hypothetical protein [Clostridia bacterium]